ncbi:aldo/keto reductase [Paenibacillus sp. 1P07SE]|uniref:AraC family transcriptional regulator n=1 Tax=Paenibacillus sp. 1P07SE TaxID=3132209 RepID=UPI0039A6604F
MDLPITAEVLEASAEVPNLSCKIEFTRSDILALLSDDAPAGSHKGTSSRSLNVAALDVSLLDAVVRLIGLLDKPADIPVLAPLFTKEILYRVLQSEHGRSLRQIVTDGTPAIHIQHAIQHLLNHFQESLQVKDLAEIALAWLYRNPVVAAPIVGATKTSHIDDALKAVAIKLTDAEAARLEQAYTPRIDVNVRNSDPKAIVKMAATVGNNISVPVATK